MDVDLMQAETTPCGRALPRAQHYLSLWICGLLFGYIALLPFTPLLNLERNGFLILLGSLAAWCLVNRKLFYVQTPYDPMLLAFLMWVALTLPFAVSPLYSMQEYGKLLQQVLIFYAVVYFLNGHQSRRTLFYLIAGLAIVVAGYGLTQFNLTNAQDVKSFFSSEVWLTTFLIMVFPFSLALAFGNGPSRVKILAIVASVLFFTCLWGTQSRAGLISFLTVLWVMAWLFRSRRSWIVAAAVTILLVLAVLVASRIDVSKATDPMRGTNLSSATHRFNIWTFALPEILKHGIVGIGYGNHSYPLTYGDQMEVVEPGHSPVRRVGTHNIFLYMALHIGLPGLALFGWLYYTFVVTTIQEYRNATDWLQQGILAGSVGSLLGLLCRVQFDQMLVGSLAVFFWVLMAMAVLQYPSLKTSLKSSLA